MTHICLPPDDDSYFNNPEVFGVSDAESRKAAYTLWEEFAQVATKLLERIEEVTTLPVLG